MLARTLIVSSITVSSSVGTGATLACFPVVGSPETELFDAISPREAERAKARRSTKVLHRGATLGSAASMRALEQWSSRRASIAERLEPRRRWMEKGRAFDEDLQWARRRVPFESRGVGPCQMSS